jgi:hypothetical protein
MPNQPPSSMLSLTAGQENERCSAPHCKKQMILGSNPVACSNCAKFPPYSLQESALYCSKDCLEQDEKRHEIFCTTRTSRTRLRNAARLLDATNRTIRPLTNEQRVGDAKVMPYDGNVNMLRLRRSSASGYFHSLPAHLANNMKLSLSINMAFCCQMVLSQYLEMIKVVLIGMYQPERTTPGAIMALGVLRSSYSSLKLSETPGI